MKGRQRRWISITITVFCLALTVGAIQAIRDQLGDESTFTGWTLLTATAGLYLLSIRKQMIRAKLGPVAAWLQMHVYMGVFASVVFLMHIGWPIRGVFESILAVFFVIVAVTGILLGILSRTTPRRMATIPEDYAYDQIPAVQLSVANAAHELAIHSVDHNEGATLSEYYQRRLLPYFQNGRSWLFTFFPTSYKRRMLLRELEDLDRYLGQQGIQSRISLAAMVKTKDDMDYHRALQSRLKAMFLAHVSLTWSLVVMIGVHVVFVYRFQAVM